MIVDSRSIDNSCRLQSEICIVGAGAAGITLALEFLSKNFGVILLERGGARSDSMTQSLYAGENAGLSYDRLEETRSRYLGGSTNCWGGWCRPLDSLDFEKRDWVPNSGWSFGKEEMYRHYVRSHSLLQLGPFNYDQDFWSHELAKKNISLFPLDGRRIDNIVSQFSPAVTLRKPVSSTIEPLERKGHAIRKRHRNPNERKRNGGNRRSGGDA